MFDFGEYHRAGQPFGIAVAVLRFNPLSKILKIGLKWVSTFLYSRQNS